MLPCKDIVKLLSSEEKVTLLQRAELKMHLMMCEHCSTYSRQLKFMRNGFKKLFSKLTTLRPGAVEQLETKVIQKIKKSSGE